MPTVTPGPVPTPRGAAGWSCSPPWPARVSAGGWRPASAPRWGRHLTRPPCRPRCPPCRWWWRPCWRRARTRRGHCAPSDATCSRTGATWRWSCAGSCTGTSAACSTGRPRPGLDLSAPLVVLDLSALYSSAALGVLMACATAWLQAALARTAARRLGSHCRDGAVSSSWSTKPGRSCPISEWRAGCSPRGSCPAPSGCPMSRSCTGSRTCARSAHRTRSRWRWPRDCSRTRRPAWSTPSRPASWRRRRTSSPCRPPRRTCLPQLRRGIALWKVGQRSFLVQHRLSAMERCIVDTDAAMTAR